MATTDLIHSIKLIEPKTTPIIIAVSGFGGSGKSTLATKLASKLPNAAIISSDDFIIGPLDVRSDDWSCFDRQRLLEQVLKPAVDGRQIEYQQYDWASGKLGQSIKLDMNQYLIIEGISVLHPNLLPYYDYSVWIELPLETAVKNGIERDRASGNNHVKLWKEIWGPNDEGYLQKYHPNELAAASIQAYAD
jgi:uridine kinase